MRRTRQFSCVCVSLLCLSGGLVAQTKPTEGTERVTDDKSGVSIVLPDGFDRADVAKPSIRIFAGESTPPAGAITRTNVSLELSITTDKPLPFQGLYAAFLKSKAKFGITVVSDDAATIDGLPARRIVYTHPLKLAAGTVQIKAVQWFVVRGREVWVLDFRTTDERFADFTPVADRIAASLKWETPKTP